jgi:Polycystin cation channel
MNEDTSFDILVILAILISIQFARLLFSLQVNRNIGPMVKILGSMFIDVSIFLVLFVTIFLIFLAIGQLLFEELAEFTSPTDAAITLFSASLGNFDYSIFNVFATSKMYAGYVYLTIYLLYTSIMLLNFLIAILSNTYARNNFVKNGLYLRNVLHLRQRYDYDRLYSSITYSAPPLNIITFILTPLII